MGGLGHQPQHTSRFGVHASPGLTRRDQEDRWAGPPAAAHRRVGSAYIKLRGKYRFPPQILSDGPISPQSLKPDQSAPKLSKTGSILPHGGFAPDLGGFD